MTNEKKSTSRERAAVLIKAALEALKDAGGSLRLKEIKQEVAKRVSLTDHDLKPYEKTGYVRWESILHFYSIDCVKAGFIKKHAGQWHLTPDGEKVSELSGNEILDRAVKAYRDWKAAARAGDVAGQDRTTLDLETEPVARSERSFVFETAESEARTEIEDYVRALGPYEIQELVAALLRGMGYTTPFVAPSGPDGGTDVLAYPDPIGAKTPHIRVQVKHRAKSGAKATREEIAALRGIIRQDREIGLFVSSSGFTSDAIREARQGAIHIELMDLNGLLEQWETFYERLPEEDKQHLRLRKVFFLSPD